MLALVDPTTIKSTIERQVSEALGNYRIARKEGNLNQEYKEGMQIIGPYKEFVNSKPRPFYGDEGVHDLIHLVKEMENKCAKDYRVKFTTYTFIGKAFTW